MILTKGTRVVVTTYNNGLVVNRKRPRKAETWRGVIVGPSVFGVDWFLVKRDKSGMGAYTVPLREIALPKDAGR